MAEDINIDIDDFTPETFKHIIDFVGEDAQHEVDTSWLRKYDRGTMDMIARWRATMDACKSLESDKFAEDDEESALRHALSTAYASTDVLSVISRSDDLTTLFMVVLVTSAHAYEFGVRDAYEQRLSPDAMKRLAQSVDRGDAKREAMLEFHKEVQQL